MSATSILLVAASIIAIEGGAATIDAGKSQHLEPGDRGQAFYELIVDGRPTRIEAGPVRVTAVEDRTATVDSESDKPLRPGYRIELRLPVDRMPDTPMPNDSNRPVPDDLKRPAPVQAEPVADEADAPLKRPASVPAEAEADEADAPLKRPVSVPVESMADEADARSKRPVPAQADTAAPAPPAPTRDVVFISSGPYSVGLDPSAAQFFNQTPRHEVELLGFSIDRLPSGDGRPLGLAFAEARAHCQGLGFRLPTEEEWEVAAQVPGFEIQPGVFEWTASWYQAYPGNSRAEKEYGESYRVLRGTSDWSDESLYTRRFMEPTESNAQVGFRCLKGIE